MFGIGSTELLVILVVALIVLGPKSLAGVSRSIGKAVGEFRRVSTDFQRTLNAEAAQEELRETRMKREAGRQPDAAPKAQKADAGDATANGQEFERQMSRIGKWEKPDPNGDFSPPPGSPLADALSKASEEAANSAKTADNAKNATQAVSAAQDGKPNA